MKKYICLIYLLSFLPTISFSQVVDSVITKLDNEQFDFVIMEYYENGKIKEVSYSKRKENPEWDSKTVNYSPEERFLRGISNQKSVKYDIIQVDSIFTYNEKGNLNSVSYPELALYEEYYYNDDNGINFLERTLNEELMFVYGEDKAFGINSQVLNIGGKIGDEEKNEFILKNYSEEEIRLEITTSIPNVYLQEEVRIPPKETYILNVTTRILNDETFGELVIVRKNENPITFPVSISGYDLNETDFKGKDHTVEFTKRKVIYLNIDSASKLLNVYKDGKIIFDQSIAKSSTELNVEEMGKGTFLLEAIDLSINEKTYCLLTIK